MGEIIVYIDETTDSFSRKIFKKRVINEYYNPEFLAELSKIEKLPEIFDNPNLDEKTITSIDNYLDIEINNFINSYAEIIYKLRNWTERIPTMPTQVIVSPTVNRELLIEPCDNNLFTDTDNIDEEDIITYIDKGMKYCFSIQTLKQQFDNDNFINEETGNKFSQQFINKINSFNSQQTEKTKKVEKQIEKDIILAPNLLDIITKNIEKLEYIQKNGKKSYEKYIKENELKSSENLSKDDDTLDLEKALEEAFRKNEQQDTDEEELEDDTDEDEPEDDTDEEEPEDDTDKEEPEDDTDKEEPEDDTDEEEPEDDTDKEEPEDDIDEEEQEESWDNDDYKIPDLIIKDYEYDSDEEKEAEKALVELQKKKKSNFTDNSSTNNCLKCKKILDKNNTLKTTLNNKEVEFCGFDCFIEYNKFHN